MSGANERRNCSRDVVAAKGDIKSVPSPPLTLSVLAFRGHVCRCKTRVETFTYTNRRYNRKPQSAC